MVIFLTIFKANQSEAKKHPNNSNKCLYKKNSWQGKLFKQKTTKH